MLSIIVAVAKNNAIGKNNELLWHISEDLKYFKKITTNSIVIMGENTWKSLPNKPLPNRENIVISNNLNFSLDNAKVFHNVEDLLEYCKDKENCFVIGGGMLYHSLMPYCDKLYVTKVYKAFSADTFFPFIEESSWHLEESSEMKQDITNGLRYQFLVYSRIRPRRLF
ncbi:MAG: dihydrofolate reductase [Bacteroidales bacterium]|jgi:dihydrofolate reductase|nr:dihydrofolate reductase [Bacteroidales bacterium]